jgi:anti-anti-sigma factor
MDITEARAGRLLIVALRGRIDTTTAPQVEHHLLGRLSQGDVHLIVDFAGIEYISSAGLRVMLALARRTRDAHGSLALCGMGEAVQHVFRLAGFLPLFVIVDSRDAAIARLTNP